MQIFLANMKGGERMKVFILLFLFCIFLIACSNPAVEIVHSVKGTVTDSLSGAPIPNAWIKLNDTLNAVEYFSDNSGFYVWSHLDGITNGTLYVGKNGYYTKSKYIPNLQVDITGIDFQLFPINRK